MKDNPENEVTAAQPQQSDFFGAGQQDSFFPGGATAGLMGPQNTQALGGGGGSQNPMATALRTGNVVHVDVRSQSGAVDAMTKNYPVEPDGTIHLPMIGNIAAAGKTTTQLNVDIRTALMNGFLNDPVVNVSPVPKTIDYTHLVAAGETIFVRVLGSDGSVEFDGNFPVDSNGVAHIPGAGDVNVLGKNFSQIGATIRSLLISRQILNNPTVHVADSSF